MTSYTSMDANQLHKMAKLAIEVIDKRIKENNPESYMVSGMMMQQFPSHHTHHIHEDRKVVMQLLTLSIYATNKVEISKEDITILDRYK